MLSTCFLFVYVILSHVAAAEITALPDVKNTDLLSCLPQVNVTSTDPNVTSIAVNVTSRDQITGLWTTTKVTQNGM